ncbi:threonine--tRNA ligase [Paenibacillus glufosinatiresistens]|uniref:threonine--tRNA ligase n=1 Tax=Paenibacillus glufosinatiresistens TaxID=3070657 RepID=UPI00286EB0F4|nr:threonine--tRNA ligase [Paenibacillus sp. YX.27]
MRRLAEANLPMIGQKVSREEAAAFLETGGQTLRLEALLQDPEKNAAGLLYPHEGFALLCRGPLLPRTGMLKAVKLLGVAGAYWQGDAKRPMLQRIHGTAYSSGAELAGHLQRLEEARRRDHRKLGRELELFLFSEEAPGMPFYLPNGMVLRQELQNLSRRLMRRSGYQEVLTPLMMNNRLWEKSGHYDHYKAHMYFTNVDETPYALKPMNCPGHMLIYKSALRSYRDLPIRLAEFGQVHRHEFSGALGGMTRVRSFCQDDAHLFVAPGQIEEEIAAIIALIGEVYDLFGLYYRVELSTRPEDSLGSPELWEQAEQGLRRVLERMKLDYRLNEGDGAFYGPKIDFHLQDSLGRSWQCGTIQLDFQMPEKFDLAYIGEDGERHRPVVIHRAIYGALDRFIGVLTEHYGGAFPAWLSPVQAVLLPVSVSTGDYAHAVQVKLEREGIRTKLDSRSEKIGYRIREAALRQTPYILIIGEKEKESNSVTIRLRGGESLEQLPLDSAVKLIAEAARPDHSSRI